MRTNMPPHFQRLLARKTVKSESEDIPPDKEPEIPLDEPQQAEVPSADQPSADELIKRFLPDADWDYLEPDAQDAIKNLVENIIAYFGGHQIVGVSEAKNEKSDPPEPPNWVVMADERLLPFGITLVGLVNDDGFGKFLMKKRRYSVLFDQIVNHRDEESLDDLVELVGIFFGENGGSEPNYQNPKDLQIDAEDEVRKAKYEQARKDLSKPDKRKEASKILKQLEKEANK